MQVNIADRADIYVNNVVKFQIHGPISREAATGIVAGFGIVEKVDKETKREFIYTPQTPVKQGGILVGFIGTKLVQFGGNYVNFIADETFSSGYGSYKSYNIVVDPDRYPPFATFNVKEKYNKIFYDSLQHPEMGQLLKPYFFNLENEEYGKLYGVWLVNTSFKIDDNGERKYGEGYELHLFNSPEYLRGVITILQAFGLNYRDYMWRTPFESDPVTGKNKYYEIIF